MTLGLTPEQQDLSDAVGQFAEPARPDRRDARQFRRVGVRGSSRDGGMRWSPTAFTRSTCRNASVDRADG